MKHETKTPGVQCVHAIVTPTCMQNRRPVGAIEEANRRVQEFFLKYFNLNATYHVVLTVEWPVEGTSDFKADCPPSSSEKENDA